MCGRFTQSYTWRELVEIYRLTQPARNLRPRYNIAPTTAIDVVRLTDTGPELVPMRWGLIPGWWKKTAKEVPSTFNARAETAPKNRCFARPSNAPAASCQRPAIMSGARSKEANSPISSARRMARCCRLLAYGMSGETLATSETIVSATLIVTAANDFTRRIHDRMPVFLGQHDHDAWLTGKAGAELLRAAPNDLLRMWPVSKRVNASGRGGDDLSLIEPIEDEAIATG